MLEDLDACVVDINERAAELIGWRREQIVGRPADLLVPPEGREAVTRLRAGCRAGAQVRDVEARWRPRNGEPFAVSLSLELLPDETGEPAAIAVFARDLRSRKAAEERKRLTQWRAVLADERERRELALDLHDSLAQLLAVARMKLASVREALSGAPEAVMRDVDALIEEADRRTRTMMFRVNPPALHDIGLVAALEDLATEMQTRFRLRVRVTSDDAPDRFDHAARLVVFRAVRELLHNVCRHARTSTARVAIVCGADPAEVRVEDDGAGFDGERVSWGLGLTAVRERLESLGGRLEIDARPGRGTRVRMLLPSPRRSEGTG